MTPSETARISGTPGIQRLAEILQEAIGATAVWLFGSHARGEAGPDSDVDILVIVEQSPFSRYQRAVRARKAVHEVKLPKDIVVVTQDEWDKGLRAPCSLPSTVAREGVRII